MGALVETYRSLRKICDQRIHVFIGPRSLQYFDIAERSQTPPLTLQRSRHDSRSTRFLAPNDEVINEIHKIIWQPHGDLLAHTDMVSIWDAIAYYRSPALGEKAHSGSIPLPSMVSSNWAME